MIKKLKIMRTLLYIAITLFAPLVSYAQDIEGVEICTKMTHEQVVAKFGEPDKVDIQDADWPEGSKIRYYHYGNNKIVFSDHEGLIEFGVTDNRFALIVNYLSGGLRIGDSLTKIHNIDIKGRLQQNGTEEDGSIIYNLFTEQDDLLWIWAKNGEIIYMDLSVSI